MLGVFSLDAGRLESVQPHIDENHIAFFNGRQNVSVTGVIVVEPEISDRSSELKVKS